MLWASPFAFIQLNCNGALFDPDSPCEWSDNWRVAIHPNQLCLFLYVSSPDLPSVRHNCCRSAEGTLQYVTDDMSESYLCCFMSPLHLGVRSPLNLGLMSLLHLVEWESAKVKEVAPNLAHRRIVEALHIHRTPNTTNLDCGLTLDSIWFPLLTWPPPLPPPN